MPAERVVVPFRDFHWPALVTEDPDGELDVEVGDPVCPTDGIPLRPLHFAIGVTIECPACGRAVALTPFDSVEELKVEVGRMAIDEYLRRQEEDG